MRYAPKRIYNWSPQLAYVVGLITADGCLLNDNRHIDFTSKDRQLVELYRSLVRPDCFIGIKHSGSNVTRPYFRVQLSDVALYDFLLDVGLVPRKSKVLGRLIIRRRYFADFLRGLFDGDGSIYGVADKRWRNSYMFYTTFSSASPIFLQWLQATIAGHLPELGGHIRKSGPTVSILCYAKRDSRKLFQFMYYGEQVPRLERKFQRYLEIFARDPYAN